MKMNEVEKNMDNYIKELLTINKDINKQLQAYKDREDKLIKWCYNHGQEINATDILDIINPKILNDKVVE